jgi:predicted transcriptional regulator
VTRLPEAAVPLPADRWRVLVAVCTDRHPSLRSVADTTGIPWGSIHGHLCKLRDLGLVAWTPGHVGSLHPLVSLVWPQRRSP